METGLRQYNSSRDLSLCGVYQGELYRSRWFRGLEPEMEWLRLVLEGTGRMQVRIYVSDEAPEKFFDPSGWEPVLQRQDQDLLLYGVRGEYLCFTVEPGSKLKQFRLEFPGHSIDEGLPGVLQQNDTLRMLLGVYQSRFMDLNRMAANFTESLDPESSEPIPQLDRWLGTDSWMFEGEQEKKIRSQAPLLNRFRGTGKGIKLLSLLVLGTSCEIMESCVLKGQELSHKQKIEDIQLYGGKGEGIAILIPPHVSHEKREQFESLLPDFVPLGISCQVIYLSEDMPMDGHSYLDINVALQGNPVSRMDGSRMEEVILE